VFEEVHVEVVGYGSVALSTGPFHRVRYAVDIFALPPAVCGGSLIVNPARFTRFFSEKLGVGVAGILVDSSDAKVANAQQVPKGFWSLTGLTFPESRKSNVGG
jgi:hypothetical protein